ncbi:MAG: efflux RND transporter periplasmic adaptor subunit [Bacteroidia bacterium]|nr:efflux RND transporter periplasmic adaptor subunit [Bacteroidia bacterium]
MEISTAPIKRVILFSIVIAVIISCNKKFEQSKAIKQDITESVFATGVIKSVNQYQVFSNSNGIIEKIYVKEGDLLNENQPILKVTNETVLLNSENAKLAAEYNDISRNTEKLEELKSNIEFLKSKLKTDSLMYIRQQNLWENNIGSKIELEKMELNFKNSKTALESAYLRYKDLKKQLSLISNQSKNNYKINNEIFNDFTVKSRIKGKIYSLLKKEGEMVNVQTPVAVIGSADSFIIELQIDEYDIAKVKIGQEVFVIMDSYNSKVFQAVVSRIYPAMNERTRSFTLEAVFINPPNVLYPNITAEANIVINTIKNAVTIDRKYLVNDSFVYISKKEKIKVKTGLQDLQKIQIISGLKENEEIYIPLK